MDDPTFHLYEGTYLSGSQQNKNSFLVITLGMVCIGMAFAIISDLFLFMGIMLIVVSVVFRGSDVKKHAAVDFYPSHAMVLSYKKPGALTAKKGMTFSRNDVKEVKIIRQRMQGVVDQPKAGSSTGVIFILRNGKTVSLVNRLPDDILALDAFLRGSWGLVPIDPAVASAKIGASMGKDLTNDVFERARTVKLILFGLLFGCFILMLVMGIIVAFISIVGFGYIAIAVTMLVPATYVSLRDRKAYTGIKAVTIREDGLDIHFDLKTSKFYSWSSIKYLSMFPVTQYLNARDQNGYIMLNGRVWTYFLKPEVAEVAIAAYERAMRTSPPAKQMWS